MTEKEKYIAVRTSAKILQYNVSRGYRDDEMIQWTINNELYKRLNRKMNELYQLKKSDLEPAALEEIDKQLAEIYNQRMEISAEMINEEMIIRIPDSVTSGKTSSISRKRAVEQYIQLQMFILLAQYAPDDDSEIYAMIQWCSASKEITDINKKIKAHYAVYYKRKNTGAALPDINELNSLKKKLEQAQKERETAENTLRMIAKQQNHLSSPFLTKTQTRNKRKKR